MKNEKTENVLVVKNKVQQILFLGELVGQFSDGKWENATPSGHWLCWSKCKVEVGEKIGKNFYAQKDAYDLIAKDLLEAVGDRMIEYAKLAIAFPDVDAQILVWASDFRGEDSLSEYVKERNNRVKEFLSKEQIERAEKETVYTLGQLKKDLRDIKEAMKITLKYEPEVPSTRIETVVAPLLTHPIQQEAIEKKAEENKVEKKFVKPLCKLIGADGNAYAIMGRVVSALKKAGYRELIDEYQKKAMSGNYDHLLAVSMEYVTDESEVDSEE